MDKEGNIITNPERLKQIYVEAYTERLQHREILPHLQEYKILREQVFHHSPWQQKKTNHHHGQWSSWNMY